MLRFLRLAAGLAATVSCAASAQYVLSGSTADEPNLVCKASPIDSDTFYASETVPYTHEAELRFRYYANKWGEQIGHQVYYTCESYERMTPEYDASWRPGNTYVGATGKTFKVEKATFLPENWDTVPTPEEKAKGQAQKTGKKGQVAKPITAADATPAEPKKSAAQIAAEEAAARKAKYEAEFQAKQDEYERQLAERDRKVREFNELTAKMEAQKQANLAAAEAAANAYKQEQDKYAQTIRQHQDEVARYNAQVNGSAPPAAPGKGGRFQATGAIVDTREAAMAALLRHPKGPELVDIQCDTIKMFDPPKWTCWGFYYETITPQGGSRQ